VNLTEPGKSEECASCGSLGASRLVTEADEVLLCEGCADRLLAGEASSYWLPTKDEPPEPPEERFAELFEAARALLKKGETEEDQIYPTLAFANELGQGLEALIEQKEHLMSAWEDGSDNWADVVDVFSRRHPSIRPVEVVDGVVILERVPMSVRIDNYPIQDVEVPRVIVLTIYPHKKPPTLEQVTALYDSELAATGIPHTESREGRFEFSFRNSHLLIEVHHSRTSIPQEHIGTVFRDSKPEFLHPRLVGAFCKMLLGTTSKDGFARLLVPRKRGPIPPPDNIIPASVAFYLRDYGGMKEGMAAHRLLNEHVLRTHWKTFPEGHSDPASIQLWRDVDKVKNKLLAAAHAIHWYDPE
jgi:hypothetical protein